MWIFFHFEPNNKVASLLKVVCFPNTYVHKVCLPHGGFFCPMGFFFSQRIYCCFWLKNFFFEQKKFEKKIFWVKNNSKSFEKKKPHGAKKPPMGQTDLTLNKKTIFFFTSPLSKKIKGGAGDLVGENALFWADRNFWLMGWPGSPKIGRGPISAMLHTPLLGISISMKNKKVMLVESYVMPKNQKSWLPPLPLALNVRIFQVCPEMSENSKTE